MKFYFFLSAITFKKASRISIGCMLLAMVTSISARADDAIDNAIKEAMMTFNSVASLFSLANTCPQYSSMAAVESCELADSLAQGVVCPPLTAVDTSQEPARTCSIQFKDVVTAELGVGAMARLKASDIDSYEFRLTYKPVSSVDRHLHDNAKTPGGTDPDSWIKRKDRVQMVAAIYDGSEVSATVPIPNPGVPLSSANNAVVSFTGEVKQEQGAAVAWEGILCGFVEHAQGSKSCPAEVEDDSSQDEAAQPAE